MKRREINRSLEQFSKKVLKKKIKKSKEMKKKKKKENWRPCSRLKD